jgi:sugar phosphate isomerase/epimerase
MSLDFGLQLFSVRESLRQDAVGTLEKIAEIGYRHLQPAIHGPDLDQVAGTLNAREFRKRVDGLGMTVQSIHARVDEQTDWDRMIALNQELGSSAIALPIAYFADRAGTLAFAAALNRYGEVCRAHGLRFYYHNHFQEFQVMAEETVMDLLLQNTDPDLVGIEFDTYWAARGGADPVEWLLKLGDRCDLTHQKDLPAAAKPVNLFDVFGKDARITLRELNQTQKPDQFAEVGEGTMDLPALIETMRRTGVKYVFVEQDMTPRDEIESIRISYRKMVALLQQ